MEQSWKQYLKSIYFNPSHPASYEGINKLYDVVKKEGKFKISREKIKNWLQSQVSYSLNKPVSRKFRRGRVLVKGIDDQFDADLASLIRFAKDNDGYKYLLVVIDIFSRYGWVEPLKDKTAPRIVRAFTKILREGRVPRKLRTDAATDFSSGKFQKLLKDKDIVHITTHSEKQANYVERFIKTIKAKIFRYMSENKTSRYIDILPRLVNSYNKTWHSGILSEPINVNKENESRLWWQMYWPEKKYIKSDKPLNRKRQLSKIYKFRIGDKVRISYVRKAFQREYESKWSYEIFTVVRRFLRQGQPIYKLVDWFNEDIEGTFYQKELQKVDVRRQPWQVQEILDSRGLGRKKEYLVKWIGWPKKFNSWISVEKYKRLK